MNVVLDTNVFISGIFFSGPPYRILKAWCDRKIKLIISQEILEEYKRVGEILAEKLHGLDIDPIIALLTIKAELTIAPALHESVCDDPDDDKFFACALASKAKLIVSGDKHLLRESGFRGIKVMKPRKFVEEYL